MTDDEAYAWYKQTGEHLGKFKSVADADGFAERLHQQQANMSSSGTSGQIDDVLAGGDASLGPDPEAQPAQPQLPPAPKQRKILVADYEGEPQEFDMSAMEEQKDAELRDHIAKLEAERDMPGNEAMVPKIQAEIIAARTKMSKEGHKAILDAQSQDQKTVDKLMLQNDKQEGDMERTKYIQEQINARKKKAARMAAGYAKENKALDQELSTKDRNQILSQHRALEIRVASSDKLITAYQRLVVAKEELNLDPSQNKNSYALAETMLNQMGVLRRGVPVKNETDFVLKTMNQLDEWVARWRGVQGKSMDPDLVEKVKIANDILLHAYKQFILDAAGSVKEGMDDMSQPARKYAQNLTNQQLAIAGIEPVQYWKDTPRNVSSGAVGKNESINSLDAKLDSFLSKVTKK
jgi:hypothetical protein